jgi:hypothetical protein
LPVVCHDDKEYCHDMALFFLYVENYWCFVLKNKIPI